MIDLSGVNLGNQARRVIALVCVFLVVTLSATPAVAFCPSNGVKCIGGGIFLGGIGRSHQDITVDAVRELYAELFPGVVRSASMDKALIQIYKANIDIDLDQSTSAKHFDGENFAGGQQFIASNRDLVVSTLAKSDANGARAALGRALHTVQDFYAHSTWIELGNLSPNANVGRGTSIPHASTGTATCSFALLCDTTNWITNSLTSGYYGGEDATPTLGVRKCFHGGLGDTSALPFFDDGINKDMENCQISPHEALHRIAAAVAKDATQQFIRDIRDLVTPKQLRLLFGVGPTLAMAIDTTGSMGPIIDGVKAQAISIVDSRLGTADEPGTYVLSPFNDPNVGPVIVTTDADTFKNAISALSASGGGDCPELAFTGMEQAIASSDDGAELFVFTDASAKDSAKELNVKSLAKTKGIQISMGIFGNCVSPFGAPATLSRVSSQQSSEMFSHATATLGSVDAYYTRTSVETGGQVFALSSSEASNITKLADTTLRASAIKLLMVSDSLGSSPRTYSVPVDPSVPSVTFSVSGVPASGVTVKRPSGTPVGTTDPDASFVLLSSGAIVAMTSPAAGTWTVMISGPAAAPFSLNVDGTATLRLSSVSFVEERGRPGHRGLFGLAGLPVAGVPSTLVATMTEGFTTVSFAERDLTNSAIAPLSLVSDPDGSSLEVFGDVTPPNGTFLIYATGTDTGGKPFQRVLPFVVAPQTVTVTAPPPAILARGVINHYQFQVTNLGSGATFTFVATDDKGFVSNTMPLSAPIATNETKTVTVDLTVPADAPAGASDTLTLTAASSLTNNFAVVTSSVQLSAGPTATSISPTVGPISGGTPLTITGTNLAIGASVLLGGVPATNVVRVSDTTITALSPSHAAGLVDVAVTNPDAQSSSLVNGFAYVGNIPFASHEVLVLIALMLALIGVVVLRVK